MPGTKDERQWRARFDMSRENLELLKELTEMLPPIPMSPSGVEGDKVYRYPTEDGKGTVMAWKLVNLPMIAVAQFFLSEGTAYPEHAHEAAKEWVIVYDGALSIEATGSVSCPHIASSEPTIMKPGDCVHFTKGQAHKAKALKDTWLVAITIPRDPAYPE